MSSWLVFNFGSYLDDSPIYQVVNVRKPMLILHGLDDDVVPSQTFEEWVEALRRAGRLLNRKPARMNHSVSKKRSYLDAYGCTECFLD